MGVPKFFRYMSERYPSLSQLVQEFEIPEIDNLYLDMNGIIHVCSHPNDFDPHFRITEQEIFTAIFHYIEFLFKTIKPQKVFFLAVDGVAPRAKMNQQRGRRFRSAKEAEVLEAEAMKKGEKLPAAARFDSNCITPGTVFMDRLQQQLQYFISDKISSDPLWRDCSVILSGHETPGEGEHKIMDYIRYLKTRPGYDPNIRHCLYGLDADLIMLGLCTHDPNFCLLREEVKYSKKAQKRIYTPEQTKYYLLHLSLMREYLDLEFQELKKSLPFPYSVENIIDDWVLMGFLVGNDFIPHLPDLHINKGALEVLYKAYKEVLPTLDGYLNENGYLNLKRFQKYLSQVAEFDMENFEEQYADLNYLEEKTGRKAGNLLDLEKPGGKQTTQSAALQRLIRETDKMFDSDSPSDNSDDDGDKDTMVEEFCQHKTHYYRSKMDYTHVTEEVLKSQAEGYIRAIQWNLHYYYHGCQSWSWFYPHHYSPFVSDVTNFADLDLTFDMGKPFLPFHQLLAVLPPASKCLLPEAYQPLMTSEDSPIIDFYPPDFLTDLNGKQQDWEAVVLIPFIKEDRLLEAMESCKDRLTDDEMRRNTHGPMQKFTYSKNSLGVYKSDMFPDIAENHASVQCIWPSDIAVPLDEVQFGLQSKFSPDVYIPGFPSLRFIPHTAELKSIGVKVFDYPARGQSMVITVTKQPETDTERVASQLLGKVVFVNWPHMVQAMVSAVCDGTSRFTLNPEGGVVHNELRGRQWEHWRNVVSTIREALTERRGIVLNDVIVTISAKRLLGHKLNIGNDGTVATQKLWASTENEFAEQTILKDVRVQVSTRHLPTTIQELFPVGAKVILLVQPNYGAVAEILEPPVPFQDSVVTVQAEFKTDPEVNRDDLVSSSAYDNYMPVHAASRLIGAHQGVFARITGACYLSKANGKSINIGLNLKFSKKNQEVPGYTRRDGITWLYSDKTIELVNSYWQNFPEIFDYLMKNNTMDFSLDDIYGKGKGEAKDVEIVSWLKSQPHNDVAPVACGSDLMTAEAVTSLETLMDCYTSQTFSARLKVKAAHIYKSDLVVGNVPPVKAQHELVDRVVCCRTSYTVPHGLRGYIIGIHKGLQADGSDWIYDVLLDTAFPGGLSLIGCSPSRGYRMAPSTFINITAEKRTNPVLQLRAIQRSSVNDRAQGPAAWRSPEKAKPSGPSAFASVSRSPSEHYPAMPQAKGQGSVPAVPTANSGPATMATQTQGPYGATANGHPATPAPAYKETEHDLWLEINHPRSSIMRQLPRPDALIKALNICERKQRQQDMISKSHCSVLMAHFERTPLGLPKYNIHLLGDLFVACVTLPTGNMYWGVPCDSKEAALENAALQALAGLGLTSVNKSQLEEQLKKAVKTAPQQQQQKPVQQQQQKQLQRQQQPFPPQWHPNPFNPSHPFMMAQERSCPRPTQSFYNSLMYHNLNLRNQGPHYPANPNYPYNPSNMPSYPSNAQNPNPQQGGAVSLTSTPMPGGGPPMPGGGLPMPGGGLPMPGGGPPMPGPPPMPPSNWRQPPTISLPSMQMRVDRITPAWSGAQPANQMSMGGATAAAAATSTARLPFVPLQAIIGQKATRGLRVTQPSHPAPPAHSGPADATVQPTPPQLPAHDQVNQQLQKQQGQSQPVKQQKPRRPRRIAANLNWKDSQE